MSLETLRIRAQTRPGDPVAWARLAQVAAPEEAAELWLKVSTLITSSLQLGAIDPAIEAAELHAEATPSAHLDLRLAGLLLTRATAADLARAEALLTPLATAASPVAPDARLHLAGLALSAGRPATGLAWTEPLLDRDPRAAPLHAALLLAANRPNEAHIEATHALTEARDPAQRATLYQVLGATALLQDRLDDALAAYTAVLALTPRAPQAYLQLAIAQRAQDDLTTALGTLDAGLELASGDLSALVSLKAELQRQLTSDDGAT